MSKKDKNEVMEPEMDFVADVDAKKEAKRKAAKAFTERRKAEKEANVKDAQALIDVLKADGTYDNLDESLKAFLNRLANPTRAASGSGRGEIFTALFGAEPVAGTEIGLREAFEKTYKSTAELKRSVKNWATKGIVVEVIDGATPLDTVFKLVSF